MGNGDTIIKGKRCLAELASDSRHELGGEVLRVHLTTVKVMSLKSSSLDSVGLIH